MKSIEIPGIGVECSARRRELHRGDEQNDDIPKDAAGAKFICERTEVGTVSKWLSANGWTVITSEIGYIPKVLPELTEAQLEEVGDFLHALDEHDDVHRVWAAVK